MDDIKVGSPVRPPHGLIRIVIRIEGDTAIVKQTDGKGKQERYPLADLRLEKVRGPLRFTF